MDHLEYKSFGDSDAVHVKQDDLIFSHTILYRDEASNSHVT